LIWLSWIRARIGNANPDPGAWIKINKKPGFQHAAGVDSLHLENKKVGNFINLLRQFNNLSEICENLELNLLTLPLAALKTEITIC
jgi:hypothetical protein